MKHLIRRILQFFPEKLLRAITNSFLGDLILKIYSEIFSSQFIVKIHGCFFSLNPAAPAERLISLGKYEKEVLDYAFNLIGEGDTVLDIGAGIGYYSILLGKMVGSRGKIVAVEPFLKNCRRILKNMKLNDLDNITVIPVGIAGKTGRREMKIGRSYATHRLVSPQGEVKSRTKTIKVLSLKDLLKQVRIKHINLLKIDVEGVEFEILKNAKKLLKNLVDNIIVEVHQNKGAYQEKKISLLFRECNFNLEKIEGLYPKTFHLIARK